MEYFVLFDSVKNKYINEIIICPIPFLDPNIKSVYKSIDYIRDVLHRCQVFGIGIENIKIQQFELRDADININDIITKNNFIKQKFIDVLIDKNIFLRQDLRFDRFLCKKTSSRYIVFFEKNDKLVTTQLKQELCIESGDDICKFKDKLTNKDIFMIYQNNLEKIIYYKLISSNTVHVFDRQLNELIKG